MTIAEYLENRRYPGRIIILGNTREGKAAIAYALMGRSEASRKRTLALDDDGVLRTLILGEERPEDTSLLVYDAMKRADGRIIVSNGSHTDTIADTLASSGTFEDAVMKMCAEDDAPHFTSRISGLYDEGDRSCRLAVVRREGDGVARIVYTYPAEDGYAHCIHTYLESDSDLLVPFTKDPELLEVPSTVDEFARQTWDAMDRSNRVALFVQIGQDTRILDAGCGE